MMVDLPDPDGPKITTISCSATDIVTLSSAWKSPNHLSTFSATIMPGFPDVLAAIGSVSVVIGCSCRES